MYSSPIPFCRLPQNRDKRKVELIGTLHPGCFHENTPIWRDGKLRQLETSGSWESKSKTCVRIMVAAISPLQLESEIRRTGAVGSQAVQGSRERTREAQTSVC